MKSKLSPQIMTAKKAEIITNYLNLKLSELTEGLNYWGREANNLENSENRAKECKTNIYCLKSAYNEIYSMFSNLCIEYNIH